MDEIGMPLDPRPPNIITKSGEKKVNYKWTVGEILGTLYGMSGKR